MSSADTPVIGGPPQEALQPRLSEVERITNVFTSPSKTFTDIRVNANWIAPWLLFSVLSIIFVTIVGQRITWEQVIENKMNSISEKQKSQMDQMPPEARERQSKGMLMGFKYGSYAFPLFFAIGMAIMAAIYMAVYNFGLGTEVPYKRSLAILMYAALPNLIRTVLAIITVYALSDPSTFNFENPVVTNPGFLVSESASPALYGVLSKLDIIALWSTYLTGLGFACNSKLKRSTAIGTAFGVYGAYVLCALAFSLAFR